MMRLALAFILAWLACVISLITCTTPVTAPPDLVPDTCVIPTCYPDIKPPK